MNTNIATKETIMPLRDVLVKTEKGTKHVIEGLSRNKGVKTTETYVTIGTQKAIAVQEAVMPDGTKASFCKKTTPDGIFQVWKHSGDSKVSTFSNADGDLLSFDAKGHRTIVTPSESIVEPWTMHNDESTHRKEFELERVRDICNSIIPNFFKF